jgi:hypothetical protein
MDYQRMIESSVAVHLNDSDRYESLHTSLQEGMCPIKTFTNPDECVDFITNTTNAHILLIISHSMGELVISTLHELQQIYAIYVMPTHQASWTKQYWKTDVDAITNVASLCHHLKVAIERMERDRTSISFLSDGSKDAIDPSFMYIELLTESLLEMQFDRDDIRKFADFCRKLYHGNSITQDRINSFEREYSQRSPVFW